jgi:hypothetical protein
MLKPQLTTVLNFPLIFPRMNAQEMQGTNDKLLLEECQKALETIESAAVEEKKQPERVQRRRPQLQGRQQQPAELEEGHPPAQDLMQLDVPPHNVVEAAPAFPPDPPNLPPPKLAEDAKAAAAGTALLPAAPPPIAENADDDAFNFLTYFNTMK